MDLRFQKHPRIETKGSDGTANGYLVPVYNVHDKFFAPGKEPQQVYLTVIAPRCSKGPHLHFIRTGYFTCIKGNVAFVAKTSDGYKKYLSGDAHEYQSVEVPPGIPMVMYNLGDEPAFVLNMPSPAWTPEMNDEHTADFSDYELEF